MRQALAGLLLFAAAHLVAGDIAAFQNLGFSPDGQYFQFGQFGVEQDGQTPYAFIDTVDVPRNTFVRQGRFRFRQPGVASVGDDGRKALFSLMEQALPLRRRLSIDPVRSGRSLYFRVNGEAGDGKAVAFIDFQTGNRWELALVQTVQGQGRNVQSRFHLQLTIRSSGGQVLNSLTLGTPSLVRRGIRDYRINQVILGPTEREVVVVVERDEWTAGPTGSDDWNVRYMVETARLP